MQIFAPLHSEAIPQLQQVEVATLFQLPSFQMIGLPAPEVAEAKERIRSAIEASQLSFPRKKVIVNLSPASIRKRGTGLDLAMALAVLSLQSSVEVKLVAWGELGLDGSVKPVGQLNRTLYVTWKNQIPFLIVSRAEYLSAVQCLREIGECQEFSSEPPLLIPVETLKEAWDILIHQKYKHLTQFEAKYSEKEMSPVFFPDPRSRLPLPVSLERVIGISAAGGHHILLLGPKGVGKSLAFEWLIGLLPSLTPEDRLQQRLMAELSSNSPSVKIHEKSAPFPVRRVSSQVRPSALVGGTSSHSIRPGEFSLAHGGVLIADELPEWHRDSREVFREPLERGRVSLTRTQGTFDLPANFLLAANGNLCPCGGWPPEWAPPQDSIALSKCRCRETIRRNYLARLSGPILDRIDLVSFVTYSSLPQGGGSTGDQKWNQLQTQVQEAREFLKQTWGEVPGKLNGIQLEGILDSSPLLRKSVESLEFSSFRSRHKTLRTALTLSAWDHLAIPHVSHLREAYCYRADRLSPTS